MYRRSTGNLLKPFTNLMPRQPTISEILLKTEQLSDKSNASRRVVDVSMSVELKRQAYRT